MMTWGEAGIHLAGLGRDSEAYLNQAGWWWGDNALRLAQRINLAIQALPAVRTGGASTGVPPLMQVT